MDFIVKSSQFGEKDHLWIIKCINITGETFDFLQLPLQKPLAYDRVWRKDIKYICINQTTGTGLISYKH